MLNWRQIFKNWTGIPVLIFAVLVLVFGVPYLTGRYKVWQFVNDYKKLTDVYKTDTYGGKTPEETYDLFIEALKSEDVELASKYFVAEKQDSWRKALEEYKNSELMGDFIVETEKNRKKWKKVSESDENINSYEYGVFVPEGSYAEWNGQKLELPSGTVANFTRFQKYPSGIWKIQLL